MITVNGRTFHLYGKNISYVFYIDADGQLVTWHFGKRIADLDYSTDPQAELRPYPHFNTPEKQTNLNTCRQEYPSYGHCDMRTPAFYAVNAAGNAICLPTYKSHEIISGAVSLPSLPCLFDSEKEHASTLKITLSDEVSGFEADLYYTVFDEYDIIAKSAVIRNISDGELTLRQASSACLDLPIGDYELIHFSGDWGREAGMKRSAVTCGERIEIADNTGRSSRWNNPFVMVCAPGACETNGEVYALGLIYSGPHSTSAELSTEGLLRVTQGVSPLGFARVLAPGQCFYTPQCVAAYSPDGFAHISHSYHSLYNRHLIRSKFGGMQRPILINSWESTYFDFDEDKLLALAEKAKSAGIELFVLDDGWFGQRNDSTSSLGDWTVNRAKLPSGISGLSEKIHALGMKFGLWFEPEMISRNSELFRLHPDWAIGIPGVKNVEYRNQMVLDLTRADVRDYIIKAVSSILQSARIEYVKWDMNRPVTDVPREGFMYDYVLGYYEIADALTSAFPDVLFEGCASGGGRFDAGVLHYMPQIWTSDNTDAISRLRIQYSTSMCYPLSSMGAHVSAVPNHQTGRVTPLETRAAVAFGGMFGYELDLTKLSDEELEKVSEYTEFAKHIQELIRTGDFYRLRSPYETNECIWQVTSTDASHAFLMGCRVLNEIVRSRHYDAPVKLRGLDENAFYKDVLTDKIYHGSVLAGRGITIDYPQKDFSSVIMELKCID